MCHLVKNFLSCYYFLVSAGNPRLHLKALDQVVTCAGDPSLQNALEMAMRALRYCSIRDNAVMHTEYMYIIELPLTT